MTSPGQHHTPIFASPILLGWLMVLIGSVVFTEAFADCGGYVNIGNKAKLRELRRAGFEFGSPMKSHVRRFRHSELHDSNLHKLDLQDSGPRHGKPTLVDLEKRVRVEEEQPSGRAPCTGAQCGSNPLPMSQPESIVLDFCPVKPLKSVSALYEKRFADSYIGYFQYSETPFLFKLLIDLTPE